MIITRSRWSITIRTWGLSSLCWRLPDSSITRWWLPRRTTACPFPGSRARLTPTPTISPWRCDGPRESTVPGESFTGKISKIDKFADSENRWLNPDLKEHGAEILLDATEAPLSPGDSAEVKILIDTIEDALVVPVQCVFTRGADSYVFLGSGGSAELTKVQT